MCDFQWMFLDEEWDQAEDVFLIFHKYNDIVCKVLIDLYALMSRSNPDLVQVASGYLLRHVILFL